MTKIEWKDYRRNVRYVTNAAIADLTELTDSYHGDYKPTFTILPYHHDGLYSLEQLFLEHYQDPTEFTFVTDVFEGDIKHWEEFKNAKFIHPHYVQWKAKAEGMLLSEAMGKIVATAFDESNRNSFQALKYLVERNNKDDKTAKRGRPKKEKEADKADDRLISDALKRLQEK